MKVVLDTNVLAAAFTFGGVCRAILDVCLDSHDLFASEYILDELQRVLVQKLGHSEAAAAERRSLLREAAHIVAPADVQPGACRDVSDLPVPGTLAAAGADCLVTGDKDLLELRQFAGRPILTPREFWASLR